MRSPIRTALAAGLLIAGLAATADAAHAAPPPKVTGGSLVVRGNASSERITLRLQAGHSNRLEVDLNDDGSADFRFNRNRIDRIRVNGARGNDQLRIDDANGAFTTTIPTVLDGGRGDDTLIGGRGGERLRGGRGNDTADGGLGNDRASMGAGDDIVSGGAGNDTLNGDAGDDVLMGGAGRDVLRGGAGDNIVRQ